MLLKTYATFRYALIQFKVSPRSRLGSFAPVTLGLFFGEQWDCHVLPRYDQSTMIALLSLHGDIVYLMILGDINQSGSAANVGVRLDEAIREIIYKPMASLSESLRNTLDY